MPANRTILYTGAAGGRRLEYPTPSYLMRWGPRSSRSTTTSTKIAQLATAAARSHDELAGD